MITKRDIIVNFPGTIAEAKTLVRYLDPYYPEDTGRLLSFGELESQRNDLIDTFAKELLKFLGEDQ